MHITNVFDGSNQSPSRSWKVLVVDSFVRISLYSPFRAHSLQIFVTVVTQVEKETATLFS